MWKIILTKIRDFFIRATKVVLFLDLILVLYASFIYIFSNISESVSKTILDYLKIIIWPTLILFITILFKKNISGLIERISEFEIPLMGSGKAKAILTSQQEDIKNTVLEDEGEDFKEIVAKKEVEITALQNNSEQLIDKLTRAEIELDFERIHNIIFANQVNLLEEIDTLGGKVAFTYLSDHFNKVQQEFIEVLKEWNVAEYARFLVNNGLIEVKSEVGSFFSTEITVKGKAFIDYIKARSYKKGGL